MTLMEGSGSVVDLDGQHRVGAAGRAARKRTRRDERRSGAAPPHRARPKRHARGAAAAVHQ
jgi:hypothetical protein